MNALPLAPQAEAPAAATAAPSAVVAPAADQAAAAPSPDAVQPLQLFAAVAQAVLGDAAAPVGEVHQDEGAAAQENSPDQAAWQELASFLPVWQPTAQPAMAAVAPGAGDAAPAAITGAAELARKAVDSAKGAPPASDAVDALARSQMSRLPLGQAAAAGAASAPAASGERLQAGVAAVVDATSLQGAAPVVAPERNEGQAQPPTVAAAAAAPQARSATPLLQALSDRIQWQQAQGVEVATVRLDPPQLGTVELRIQHDGAGVQVWMQASHAEVGRQLAGLAEGLRQELQARTSGEASVVVAQGRHAGANGQGGQPRDGNRPWQLAEDDEIGQALQAWNGAA
ncbi:flagellar hook-length control protein FliK [Comamonas guangdongensis]|uniref:Flagellar hook-length control protein FliK n=1 Tax=Comamonas guangdongensis TaxID=510515 RepID=A0ABV3ZRT5_9BURK